MSSRKRLVLWIAGGLAALIVVVAVAAILVARTEWFRNYVRVKIVNYAENATGGKVDIGSFDFDWRRLHARLNNIIIHGTEPPSVPPLFRARSIELDLKILTSLRHALELNYLGADRPEVNVIVHTDGSTNFPAPKAKPTGNSTILEDVVDLAIRRFDIRDGVILFAAEKAEFNAHGENLRADLSYNLVKPSYQGEISMSPLYLQSGGNARVDLNVKLPVLLERDRIELTNASIATAQSRITINGAMEHLVDLRTSAHVNAHLALEEAQRAAGAALKLDLRGNAPRFADADIALAMDKDNIRISTARVTLGQSNLEASGTLKDASGNGAAQFNARLALGELGRLLEVSARPEGTAQIGGTAKLTNGWNYSVAGQVDARNVAFRAGQKRFSNINVDSAIEADASKIQLKGLKLAAFGGEFAGNVALEEMRRLRADGRLANFLLRELGRVIGTQPAGYAGVLSGPVEGQWDLKAPAMRGLVARANLSIAPGREGVPVSGRINANYNGAADTIELANSYIALPSSRLDLSGSLGRQIQVRLVSRNLNDFLPALAAASANPPRKLPVALKNGSVTFTGQIAGKLDDPRVAGHLEMTSFTVQDRSFDRVVADLDAASSGASVRNASLRRGALDAQFQGTVGLYHWSPEPREPLSLTATIRNGDMADLLALAGQRDIPVTGALNASAQITGTVGNPRGAMDLTVTNGTAWDQHFDQLTARADFSDQLVNVPSAQLTAGTAKLDLKAAFEHPRDSFSTGRLRLHVASNQMPLDQFRAVRNDRPGWSGTLQVNADVAAKLEQVKGESLLLVSNVNANVAGRGLRMEGKNYGDVTATAQTSGSLVSYRLDSNFAGSTIRVNGSTRLEQDYPTTAAVNITGLPLDRVPAGAAPRDAALSGTLSANAQLSGTLSDPHASADLTLLNYERIDSIRAHVNYSKTLIDVPLLEVVSGAARADLTASFTHPPNQFDTGQVRFHVNTNGVQLAQLRQVQELRPGLAGTAQITADGAATVQNAPGKPPILLTSLNANASATGLQLNRKPYGDITLTAETRGSNLVFNADSSFAGSRIHGSGQAELTGDYPLSAQLTFTNLTYGGVRDWIGGGAVSLFQQPVEAVAEGSLSVSGPALRPEDLRGEINVSRLEMKATPRGALARGTGKTVTLKSEGPIRATLDRSTIRIANAKITGPNTSITLGGTASLEGRRELNLTVDATADLALLEDFNRDMYSSGSMILQAAIRGPLDDPGIVGQLQLRNAAVNYIDAPNGISRANGVIVFNGKSATIQSLSGESGGGKIAATGGVDFSGGVLTFRLAATATEVRVRYPEGASTVANASLKLGGTSDRSQLTGTVTILRTEFNPRSDFGSILSSQATPVQTPTAPNALLANMQLQVQIRTAPDVTFRTSLAQNVQFVASLQLRGTAAEPGVLGRVNITQGQLIFFGTRYTVNQGAISFYNPLRIEPVLDVNLETNVQGVDVILTVSGPIDNMTLTHRSDPPLPFNELVALLANGKAPSSDPTIAAHAPTVPPQSLEQMGESALLGQVVANPVASRLQRVFGVSQLKIAPAFVAGSELPQARVTLQQQITNNLTFTYITDVANTNEQIIRVEWAINPQFSAVATRDENGLFGIDFFYKKRFR